MPNPNTLRVVLKNGDSFTYQDVEEIRFTEWNEKVEAYNTKTEIVWKKGGVKTP